METLCSVCGGSHATGACEEALSDIKGGMKFTELMEKHGHLLDDRARKALDAKKAEFIADAPRRQEEMQLDAQHRGFVPNLSRYSKDGLEDMWQTSAGTARFKEALDRAKRKREGKRPEKK